MRRATFRAVVAAALIAAPAIATAQGNSKIYHVGVLIGVSAQVSRQEVKALRAGLASLGYIEGQNLELQARYANGDFSRLPDLARQLVQMRPVAIVVASNPAVAALRRATSTIPII